MSGSRFVSHPLGSMIFADALQAELGKDNHAGVLITGVAWDGIYVVDLKAPTPKVRACLVAGDKDQTCACWSSVLSDEFMMHHMEEDVGILDADGLPAYASYFRDALVKGVSIEANFASASAVENTLYLLFQYAIGGALLEGRMKMNLVQSPICLDVFVMMKLAYNFDPLRKISVGTRHSTATRKHKLGAGSSAEVSGEAAVGQDEDLTVSDAESASGAAAATTAAASVSAAARAKKKRTGGVNIFPGMRKK